MADFMEERFPHFRAEDFFILERFIADIFQEEQDFRRQGVALVGEIIPDEQAHHIILHAILDQGAAWPFFEDNGNRRDFIADRAWQFGEEPGGFFQGNPV